MLVYDLLLIFFALLVSPWLIYRFFIQKRYRDSFFQRFGRDFPCIEKGDKPLIWIHAVSMGETKAVSKLAKKIKEELKECLLIVSSITETGHAEAKRCIPEADYHVYLPFDFSWVIKPIVRQTRPDVVIVSETDFWYHFLKEAKVQGAQLFVVNGKLSLRSMNLFLRFSWFSHSLFSMIDRFCLQSHRHLERFRQLGIPEKKLMVTGNLKIDGDDAQLSPEELQSWKERLSITENNKVLVIGSSHDPEEKLFLNALNHVWERFSKLKVILVPRHPERFDDVSRLIERCGIPFVRYSQIETKLGNEKVILLDAMGLLRTSYQIADMALVAGSYTEKVGGHNILEPAYYGVPVIYGPHMRAQQDLVNLMDEFSAGKQVLPENLSKTLCDWLGDPKKCHSIGQNGLRLITESRGATEKTFEAIRFKL